MKIDTDLRLAIRSAISAHKATSGNEWLERRKRESTSIHELISRKKLGRQIATAKRRIKRGSEIENQGREVFGKLGISEELNYIRDPEKFRKAGGKIGQGVKLLNFDFIMAELASSEPKEANKILSKLGIKWK